MFIAHTNPVKRDATRPVLTSAVDVERYLDTGQLPADTEFLPVPAEVAITRGCFWVQPESSPFPGISSFFINPAAGGAPVLRPSSDSTPWTCYSLSGRLIIGKVHQENSGLTLRSVITGLHRPVDLTKARFIGQAEAAL